MTERDEPAPRLPRDLVLTIGVGVITVVVWLAFLTVLVWQHTVAACP